MQNTSNDTRHRYKLILCSILILECDFHFDFDLKLNNVTETTSFYTWPLEAAITSLHQDFVDENSKYNQYNHVI